MAIMIICITVVPVYGEIIDNQILVKTQKKEITTKNIEKIVIEGKNQMKEGRNFNLVLALMDYKGKILNYVTSEEFFEGEEINKINGYTKILSDSHKVRVFAWDNLDDRNLISNMVEIPIKNDNSAEEIVKIDELNMQIVQGIEYELPKEVPAIMNNGETKSVPVKWSVDSVDTTKVGRIVIKGNVIGYRGKKVILNLNIKKFDKIISIDNLDITIDIGDEFKLPNSVLATMSSGDKNYVSVEWNVDTVDTSMEGIYTFEGKVQGHESNVILTLTIQKLDLDKVVEFANSELEEVIREELGIDDGDILQSDLMGITELNIDWTLYEDLNIEDIKYLKGLETLSLSSYQYNFDLTPLANLTKLNSLNLFGNAINDIRPLERLTNLTKLNLGSNNITDISALKDLTNLVELQLNGNKITDIRLLSDMADLKKLMIGGNQIKDYSPTARYYENLTSKDFEVTILEANDKNVIEINLDIGETLILPYAIKLSNGDIVFVNWEYEKITGEENGVETIIGQEINSQNEIYIECTIGSGEEDNAVYFADSNLETAVRMAIDKNKGDIYYSDVKNLKKLDAMGRGITDLSGIENLKGLEELWLWGNSLTANQLKYLKGLNNLIRLDLSLNKINYVGNNAFEEMDKLEELYLSENEMVEISESAFNGLDNLIHLEIEENRLTNINAVKNLPSLKELYMRYNGISDISSVKDLDNITLLWASNNRISDISYLANLEELQWLRLENNNIEDISSLSGLTKLTRLALESNRVSNLDPVSGMLDLEWLEIGSNQISNIDGVSELTGLSILNLKNNKITNIEALKKLENLTQLYLAGNSITDFSPVVDFYHMIKAKDFSLN